MTRYDYAPLRSSCLRILDNGKTWSTEEIRKRVAADLLIPISHQQLRTGENEQLTYHKRIDQALHQLKNHGLVEQDHPLDPDRISRGAYRITSAGRRCLSTNPDGIDMATLRAYAETSLEGRTSS